MTPESKKRLLNTILEHREMYKAQAEYYKQNPDINPGLDLYNQGRYDAVSGIIVLLSTYDQEFKELFKNKD